MAKWNVTYDVVTPESAEDGDVADQGYEAEDVSLREAISAIGYYYRPGGRGIGLEDSGRWFSTIDGCQTGAETRYAIHPPATITAASYARVSRLLTGR